MKGGFTVGKLLHEIRCVVIVGEKLSADDADATHSKKVYKVDETGLNYKMLPKSTLATKTKQF